MDYRLIVREDLDGVLRLCAAEGWAAYCERTTGQFGPGIWRKCDSTRMGIFYDEIHTRVEFAELFPH